MMKTADELGFNMPYKKLLEPIYNKYS
jgi:hypothetical protein